MSSATWFYFVQPNMQVQVSSSTSGFKVSCAIQDMGNGGRTMLAEAVAVQLGIAASEIQVAVGDSDLPRGPVSSGSRTTASVAPVAADAARQLAEQLCAIAVDRWQLVGAEPAPGGIKHDGGHLPWAEILATAPELTSLGQRGREPNGWYFPLAVGNILIGNLAPASVTVTEVQVDTRLGRVTPLRVWAGIGVGRIYSPVLATSQVQGGIIQGLSYALYEERKLDAAFGRVISSNLMNYRIAGLGDTPPIDVHFIDEPLEGIAGGGVGLGELCTVGVAGSVGNAIAHATGWRPTQLPIRPDRVLAGVHS
jgi:xanthine dehydrogenase YagR molybdenum-binding subunit